MNDPNRPDVPEAANAPTPSEPITLPPGWEEPDEWCVHWWSKSDHEDIMTYLIFGEDGSITFKVVEEGYGFDDFPDSTKYKFTTCYTVDVTQRVKLFSSFLETLPTEEALRRFAFAKAIKKALEKSTPKSLLEAKGIPYRIS